jgi:hypothetical protein
LDRCLKPVEIHVFQVRAAQFFAVSFVESVEPNGVEDLPEWSAVTKNPDKRSFGSGAVYLERNGHETLPLGLSVMLQDTFPLAPFASSVCGRVLTKKLTRESQAVRT